MPQEMLSQILNAAGEPSADNVTFNGADPVLPLPWPVGEAGAAAIAACGVAAARLWQERGGRKQRIEVDVDAGAAAMNSNRYLKLEPAPGRAPPGCTCTASSCITASASLRCSSLTTRRRRWRSPARAGTLSRWKTPYTLQAPARA
jgi:hypothetical protein